ncbi:hypothetical protein NEUTE2DRAFT_128242 [Neurospora tetrasperma FGSC 2509]|nr:hypothetical protein NEUTE2DRAFT_128242 [Neurospora tetrasperma FGSC 2509]
MGVPGGGTGSGSGRPGTERGRKTEDGRREDGKTRDQNSGKWLAVVGDGTEGRLSGLGGGELRTRGLADERVRN